MNRYKVYYNTIKKTVAAIFCAGWGNRTPDHGLENRRFTTKLIPLKK